MTNDTDIVPEPTDAHLERLSTALTKLESRLRVDSTPDGIPFDPHPALLRSMSMLELTTRCGDLDIAFSPVGLDDYHRIAARAGEFLLGGRRVSVAALGDIIRSKEAAGRPKDRATLPILYALQDELGRSTDGPIS